MKECNRCKKRLSLDEFSKSSRHKDGLNSICKECIHKQWKEYHEKNRDEIIRKQKEWYWKNRDRLLKVRKIYLQNNKEKIKQYKKEYGRKHRDVIRRYSQSPRRIFADTISSAKKRNIEFIITLDEFTKAYNDWIENYNICAYCYIPYELMLKDEWKQYSGKLFSNRWSIDRKDNTKGYTLDNIRFCCVVCNVWKRNMPWEVWNEAKKGVEILWKRIFK